MKNKIKVIIAAATVTAIAGCAILLHSCTYAKLKRRSIYNISAQTDGKTLKGDMKFDFFNSGEEKNELYFCLYPNAFKNESNVSNTTPKEKIDAAYPDGFDSGEINILEVYCENKKCTYSLEEDEQILKVDTGKIKKNGEKSIRIVFDEKLPYYTGRFGAGNDSYNYGNWYPVLCPEVGGKTIKSTYCVNGDPFCSDVADYSVTLAAPAQMRIASTGKMISCDKSDPMNYIWQIKADNVRDFAFVMSESYNLCSEKTGNTVVYSYYFGDSEYGKAALTAAVNAIKCFSELFGEYPYETFSVAQADFYIGGMEYPNLVFINRDLYGEDTAEALEEVVVHETAHQWWYGVVGNDETSEAWLDEGLTEYSVALYLDEVYGRERYGMHISDNEGYCKVVFDIMEQSKGISDRRIDRRSRDFEHWLLYDAAVYDASAVMLDSFRSAAGKDTLIKGLKKYYADNAYRIADKDDFLSALTKAGGKNAEELILPWLNGTVYWG